jgi:hypothetical protein
VNEPKITLPKILQALSSAISVEEAKAAASHVFNKCDVPGCDKLSVGFTCSTCSRFTCNRHLYFKPGAPPVPICAACVLGSHPELLEE